jgi:hypothetical protein
MSLFNLEKVEDRLGRHTHASTPRQLTIAFICGILAVVSLVSCGGENENQFAANTAASPQATGVGNSASANQAPASSGPKSEEGSIKADPNPVAAGPGNGKTKITWKTNGKFGVVKVYVSENGQPESMFAQSAEGSVEAPWIGAGSTYEFRLYGELGGQRKLIDKVQVTRNKP